MKCYSVTGTHRKYWTVRKEKWQNQDLIHNVSQLTIIKWITGLQNSHKPDFIKHMTSPPLIMEIMATHKVHCHTQSQMAGRRGNLFFHAIICYSRHIRGSWLLSSWKRRPPAPGPPSLLAPVATAAECKTVCCDINSGDWLSYSCIVNWKSLSFPLCSPSFPSFNIARLHRTPLWHLGCNFITNFLSLA